MAELYRTDATLRIFGEDLDPDEVTVLLGGPPTESHRKGDPHIAPDGRDLQQPRKTGYWSRTAEPRVPGDLDAQVEELLCGLTGDLAVWKTITERFHTDVFCGLFLFDADEGLTLSPKTQFDLGSRGLELDLCLYGPSSGE